MSCEGSCKETFSNCECAGMNDEYASFHACIHASVPFIQWTLLYLFRVAEKCPVFVTSSSFVFQYVLSPLMQCCVSNPRKS